MKYIVSMVICLMCLLLCWKMLNDNRPDPNEGLTAYYDSLYESYEDTDRLLFGDSEIHPIFQLIDDVRLFENRLEIIDKVKPEYKCDPESYIGYEMKYDGSNYIVQAYEFSSLEETRRAYCDLTNSRNAFSRNDLYTWGFDFRSAEYIALKDNRLLKVSGKDVNNLYHFIKEHLGVFRDSTVSHRQLLRDTIEEAEEEARKRLKQDN